MPAKNVFEERKKEVETYLDYLDDFQARILVDRRRRKAEAFFKVAKANLFVMLYNLVEATTKACIEDVSSDLTAKSVRHSDLNQNARKEWVRHYFKRTLLTEKQENDQRVVVVAIIEEVLNDELIGDFLPQHVISGNVDQNELYKLAGRFGINFTGGADGTALETIKLRRNWLAHGNEKFSDLGKDYAISDLRGYAKNCFSFMRRFIKSTHDYVARDKFR